MAEALIIIGAGGFGREVNDVVAAVNDASSQTVWDLLGFVDDGHVHLDRLGRIGTRHLGTTAALTDHSNAWFVVGVGNPRVRRLLADRAYAAGLRAATLIHPTATLGKDVVIGEGSIICSHVSITTNIRIGRHVQLNLNCTVGHEAVLHDYATVFPGATISGEVVLEEDVTVGTNAAVIQGLRVGQGSFVGAGAAVVREVPPGVTVVGVPARVHSARLAVQPPITKP